MMSVAGLVGAIAVADLTQRFHQPHGVVVAGGSASPGRGGVSCDGCHASTNGTRVAGLDHEVGHGRVRRRRGGAPGYVKDERVGSGGRAEPSVDRAGPTGRREP